MNISCNSDIEIEIAKENCECVSEIEEVYMMEVESYSRANSGCGFNYLTCENPFKEGDKNWKQFSKVNTMFLKNKSETKVYEVTIQKNREGQITYKKYKLEPTEEISLGCDNEFNMRFPYYSGEPEVKYLELSDFIPIVYKIHKVKVLSEY
ncbi:hypothetical protein BWK59_00850 [Flavobacterium davisii]|uniref:Uncharacterized protein n=2 Tax=Flavobacterium davisii TaxID=2906077 RepID=A0A246GLM7_9FLAO|nr:hypothetical protein BWK59_00850 [Flavobacterium davisii]